MGPNLGSHKKHSEVITSADGKVQFIGNYDPVELSGNSVLYLGAGNKLYWPSADRTMNSFRAYFQLNGITAGDVQGGGDSGGLVSISSYVLGFGDDSETAGIIEMEANSSLFTLHSSLSAWYDLQGRKLQGKPSQKGIYINNGRKVVIK